MKQYSLFWIKPDVYSPNNTRDEYDKLKKNLPKNPYDFINYVISQLKENDFEIVEEKECILDYETAEKHYEEHKHNGWDFEWLIDFMTSWKSYWIIFYWEDAIIKWREILTGIREEYLVYVKCRRNMTHASDSIESANKEIMLHFPESKTLNI